MHHPVWQGSENDPYTHGTSSLHKAAGEYAACKPIGTSTERPGHTTQPRSKVRHKANGRSQESASRAHPRSANWGNLPNTTFGQSLNSDSWSEQFVPGTLSPRPCCHWAEWTVRSARTRNPRKRYRSRSSKPPPDPFLGLPMTQRPTVTKERTGNKGDPRQHCELYSPPGITLFQQCAPPHHQNQAGLRSPRK